MQYDLPVKSSDGVTTYTVQFGFEAEKLSVFCSCLSGVHGKFCRHKIGLLNGDRSLLVGDDSGGVFNEIQARVKLTGWPTLLTELNDADEKYRIVQAVAVKNKKTFEKIKATVEAGMKNGLSVRLHR